MPRPPSNPSDPEVEKHGRPPNLERNEPVIKYKSSRKSGGGKKGTQDEKEKMVVSKRTGGEMVKVVLVHMYVRTCMLL